MCCACSWPSRTQAQDLDPEAAEVSTQGTQSEEETTEPDVLRESVSVWSHSDTLLLIDTYRKYSSMMRNPMKKKKEVWKPIATKMNKVQNSTKLMISSAVSGTIGNSL